MDSQKLGNGGRLRPADGAELAKRWNESGLSLSAFAREMGVSPQRVRYWAVRSREGVSAKPTPKFFEVAKVVGEAGTVVTEVGHVSITVERYSLSGPPSADWETLMQSVLLRRQS